jgi:outer membrane protein assembly factor BamB
MRGVYIATAISLAACSSFKESKSPPAALAEFKESIPLKTVWSGNVGPSNDFTFSPVSISNSIFTAATDGTIVRFDSVNGREIWRIKAELPLTAGVGADNSTLSVVGSKGVLFAYDLDGKFRWKVQAAGEILSAPAVGGGVIVARGINNHVTAYDSLTGKRRWVVERSLPPLILRSADGMVIADNTVFAGLSGGKLIAINLTNGVVQWEASVGEPRGATELERVADVSGAPIIVGSDVCAVAYQGRVTCFNMKNGAIRWGKMLSSSVGLGADERAVFAVDDKDTLSAFSLHSGLLEWKNDKLMNRHLSSPVSFGRTVVVGDMKGYIHFLSRNDGSFLARTGTDGSPIIATPIVAGANVIFQTKAGKVVALAID